uniref:Uncharacterized protein n=1 Tax=Oryza sativa subsp. japonica TaxID=39947 RepID=Q75IX3_ORYSJ|nr:hypothetical protein [Oryza sativa Japonica Group]
MSTTVVGLTSVSEDGDAKPKDEREWGGGGGGGSVGRGGQRWGKRGMMTVMPVREG